MKIYDDLIGEEEVDIKKVIEWWKKTKEIMSTFTIVDKYEKIIAELNTQLAIQKGHSKILEDLIKTLHSKEWHELIILKEDK